MSKVILFSTKFPAYHPRKGEPTFFLEKIYASLADTQPDFQIPNDANDFWDWHEYYNCNKPKHHTIRSGHRFKAGDYFSPRIWGNDINLKSGKSGPYHSKQITIAPDLEVKKVWDFEIILKAKNDLDGFADFYLNKEEINAIVLREIAGNDGLSYSELLHWFKYPKSFSGQIISWNDKISY